MLVIGERINTSRPSMAGPVREKNLGFLLTEARKQVECGADYLDVNTATMMEREEEYITWAITTIQQALDVAICIDSPNPRALEAGLQAVEGRPILNSISMEAKRIETILPLVREHRPKVIALCMDDTGMPVTVDDRMYHASRLVELLLGAGLAMDDIYIDPLLLPIGTDAKSAMATLDAVQQIMQTHPGVHTVCGLSNISFGLPLRRLINQNFLTVAMTKGLDAAVLDPCDRRLMSNLITSKMILGQDDFCMGYINAHRRQRLVL
ncbi:MAG: methyltetrahydrofolate cobalamin methyltransferase [Dehalococcoidia bacterium]